MGGSIVLGEMISKKRGPLSEQGSYVRGVEFSAQMEEAVLHQSTGGAPTGQEGISSTKALRKMGARFCGRCDSPVHAEFSGNWIRIFQPNENLGHQLGVRSLENGCVNESGK